MVKLLPAPKDPIPGRQSIPPPDPILVDGEEHYEVESILDSRMSQGQLQYSIQWKGYSYEHNSWENATDVHSLALVNEFYSTHPGAPWHIHVADFNYIVFRSFPNCSTRSSLPKGGGDSPSDSISWIPVSGLHFHRPVDSCGGFLWTPCMGPHYFRPFYMGISVHMRYTQTFYTWTRVSL